MTIENGQEEQRGVDAGRLATQASRRLLLRGGLGAAPILMTAISKPVMASVSCAPASSFVSLNASRPMNSTTCGGRLPSYWKQGQNYSEWPTAYPANGSTKAMFDTNFGSVGGYPNQSLAYVLSLAGTDSGRDGLARFVVAALLNAAKGLTPSTVLSVMTAKAIWSDYVTKGYYEPTAGIRWYPDSSVPEGTGGLIAWIKTTMTA